MVPSPPANTTLHIHHFYLLCVISWHNLRKVLEPFLQVHAMLQELLECLLVPQSKQGLEVGNK